MKKTKVSINCLDGLFSKLVRLKAGWVCEFDTYATLEQKGRIAPCRRYYAGGKGLQASHFYGRRAMSTRFCLDNVDSLCPSHHRWFEEHPNEYAIWKQIKLGADRFQALRMRFLHIQKATDPWKRDVKAWIKERMRNLKAEMLP